MSNNEKIIDMTDEVLEENENQEAVKVSKPKKLWTKVKEHKGIAIGVVVTAVVAAVACVLLGGSEEDIEALPEGEAAPAEPVTVDATTEE